MGWVKVAVNDLVLEQISGAPGLPETAMVRARVGVRVCARIGITALVDLEFDQSLGARWSAV